MDVERKLYIGVVEENIDPRREGRIKVRVQTLYNKIPVEDIPWASPFSGLAGKSFEVPAIGMLVNVLFFQNDLYDPYYMFTENYNINLQNKLKDLSDDEYVNFVAFLFDDASQIYVKSNELTIDHLFNKITINNTSINHELKDNTQTLNLGSKNSEQDAVLGTRFFEWMDKFVEEIRNPFSMIGNRGAPIYKPHIIKLCMEYKMLRPNFVSKNVKIVDNDSITKLERTPKTDTRKNDVSLILSDNEEEQSALNARIQNQNDAACEKLKNSKSTNNIMVEIDPNDPNAFGSTLPLLGDKISSRFGKRIDPVSKEPNKNHSGIDISAETGIKIVSPYTGIVIKASDDTNGTGGKMIMINHGNGFTTGYCHLSKYKVKVGQTVKTGQEIAEVGNTGKHTTGSHLHFIVQITNTGQRIDPEKYFTWPERPGDAPKGTTTNDNFQGQDYAPTSAPCKDEDEDEDLMIGDTGSMEIKPGSLIFEDKVKENKEEFIQKVKVISAKLKVDPDDLMCAMYLESGLDSHIVNKLAEKKGIEGATGLIQFMPSTAASLGTTTTKLKNMSNVEQLDYVYKYFKKYTGRIKDFTTLYTIVFYPVAVGKPDNWVFGSEKNMNRAKVVRDWNPGFDINKDRYITIAEFKEAIFNRLPKYARDYMRAKNDNIA